MGLDAGNIVPHLSRDLVLADRVAITTSEFTEDKGRQNRPASQGKEGVVNAVDHFRRRGVAAVWHEEGHGYGRNRHAKADRHLLGRAGNCAGIACLLLIDVGIGEGVHAGVLERGEETVDEQLEHDQPYRSCGSDGRKEHDLQPDEECIGNQNEAITEMPQDSRHGDLEAHRGQRLRNHKEPGLDRGKAQADLVEEWKEEWYTADSQAGEKAPADRRPERPNAE